MKDFLLSKGFSLVQCKDGKFWVWETKNIDLMDDQHQLFQCTESFEDFTTSFGGWVEEHTEADFVKLIEEVLS